MYLFSALIMKVIKVSFLDFDKTELNRIEIETKLNKLGSVLSFQLFLALFLF